MPLQQLSGRWHVQLETQLKAALGIVSRLTKAEHTGRTPGCDQDTEALACGYFFFYCKTDIKLHPWEVCQMATHFYNQLGLGSHENCNYWN